MHLFTLRSVRLLQLQHLAVSVLFCPLRDFSVQICSTIPYTVRVQERIDMILPMCMVETVGTTPLGQMGLTGFRQASTV